MEKRGEKNAFRYSAAR